MRRAQRRGSAELATLEKNELHELWQTAGRRLEPARIHVGRAHAAILRAGTALGRAASTHDIQAWDHLMTQLAALTRSNTTLRPETAFGYSIGSDFRLPKLGDAVFSIDAYLTNIQGMYLTSTTVDGTYQGLPLFTTTTNNLTNARQEGIEYSFSHEVQRGWGYVLRGSLQRSFAYDLPPNFYANPATGDPYSQNLAIIPNQNFKGNLYYGGAGLGVEIIPYATGYGELSYKFKNQSMVMLDTTYYGNQNSLWRPGVLRARCDGARALRKTSRAAV